MFRQVIAGVDGGPTGRDAIAIARSLVEPGGRLAFANVHELTPWRGASGAYGPSENEESLALLEAEREATGVQAELLTVTASSVGRGLHYLAEQQGAELLAVGSNMRSLVGRVLIGDATRAALIGAPCAVAVAPVGHASGDGALRRIGVGYDGSPESRAALSCARELAARHGAALSALTVIEPSRPGALLRAVGAGESPEEQLDAARHELAELDGVDGDATLGVAGEELAAFGAGVDLLVVGSRGYGPLRCLIFGSTATHLASNARGALLVLARLAGDGAS